MNLRTFIIIAFCFCSYSECRADLIQEFKTDTTGGTATGNSYTHTLFGLIADGVTFDATITVLGFDPTNVAANLDLGGTGLGVDQGGSDSALVSNGEKLQFSMAINNESGRTVTFNGFTEVDYNNFGASDSGVLSIDNSEGTAGDNFFTTIIGADIVDISATSPTGFFAIALPGASGTANSFRIDDVTARFTGSAVQIYWFGRTGTKFVGFGEHGHHTRVGRTRS